MTETLLTWAPYGYNGTYALVRPGQHYTSLGRRGSDIEDEQLISLPISGYLVDFRTRVPRNTNSTQTSVAFRSRPSGATSSLDLARITIGPGATGEFGTWWLAFFPSYISWGDKVNDNISNPSAANCNSMDLLNSELCERLWISVSLAKIDTDYVPPWPWWFEPFPFLRAQELVQQMIQVTPPEHLSVQDLANFSSLSEKRASAARARTQMRAPAGLKLTPITEWKPSTCKCKILCSNDWSELKFVHRCRKHESSNITEGDVWNEQRERSQKVSP